MRLGIGCLLLGVALVLPFEADAQFEVQQQGQHVFVGGGVPVLFKTSHAARRVARMDRQEDRIDPWSTTLEPLPAFAAQIPPTKMSDDVDPWSGKPMQNTRVPLALDTTDPWQQ
jgi:hypothetical protein